MKPSIEIRPAALSEALEAVEYYENQRTGLGERFRTLSELTMQRIVSFPLSRREFEGARRDPFEICPGESEEQLVLLM